jgi:hypothetical protein
MNWQGKRVQFLAQNPNVDVFVIRPKKQPISDIPSIWRFCFAVALAVWHTRRTMKTATMAMNALDESKAKRFRRGGYRDIQSLN